VHRKNIREDGIMNLPSIKSLLPVIIVAPMAAATLPATAQHNEDVDLVVLVVIDMLKGDIPLAHYNRLSEGGIRHLIDSGVTYTNAHYEHSTTFTAVGHGVVSTGAPAAEHGLAGNDWADRETGERIYCVADPDSDPLVETAVRGTSPLNLTATTFSDEIVLASGGRSRTFGVSVKDRGAIIPAGRLGKAFWYEPTSGLFYTTSYYYEEMPEWLVDFNEEGHKDAYRDQTWDLLHAADTYVFSHNDDRPFEKGYYDLGGTMPKDYDNSDDESYYGGLRFSPAGDELTLMLAKELVRQEEVGQRDATDILTISLSGLDYVGHAWGTHSLEYEDMFLQVDALLEDFFAFIDEEVGLDRTLMVLTSDHGSDDIPEYQHQHGLDAGRHNPEQFLEDANSALRESFEVDDDLVMAFWNPSLFLNPQAVEENELEYAEVERALARIMIDMDGVAYAVTRTDIEMGNVADTPIMRKLVRAFHPQRSGNVLFIQDQFWYLYPNMDQFAAMHGSPYAYDTHVPIIVAGPGIPHQVVDRSVGVSDLAITITNFMRVRPPSGADGNLLVEVLSDRSP
jgi:predicted AlkP superfamily pyrophosphatase or phosphodiesterase